MHFKPGLKNLLKNEKKQKNKKTNYCISVYIYRANFFSGKMFRRFTVHLTHPALGNFRITNKQLRAQAIVIRRNFVRMDAQRKFDSLAHLMDVKM